MTNSQALQIDLNHLGMVIESHNRSKAYLQTLLKHGIRPSKVILLERESQRDKLMTPPSKNVIQEPSYYFDPFISEIESLDTHKISYERVVGSSFNDQCLIDSIAACDEDIFIFSGSGILKELFKSGKTFIHVHPGKLPEFRGSTCPYYSVLSQNSWSCSVIEMSPLIDQGKILSCKSFEAKSVTTDLSKVYDPYTRAEALIEYLLTFKEGGEKIPPRDNPSQSGDDFFIIHPILELIAKERIRGKRLGLEEVI